MVRHFRYLAGDFESQFTTSGKHQGSASVNSYWSTIRPEQRFILSNITEITAEEFDRRVSARSGPQLLVDTPSDIELRFSDHSAERNVSESLLIVGDNQFIQYIADKSNEHHGRLLGKGYCKVFSHETPEQKTEEVIPVTPAEIITPHEGGAITDIQGENTTIAQPGSKQRGCLGSFLPSGAGAGLGGPGSPGGCFGGGPGGAFGGSGMSGLPGMAGGTGCAQWGCGAILLLLALGMLAGMLKQCANNGNGNSAAPIIIHDTIYVEVQRVDTVKVLKIDTLRLVDSVRQVTYETVTLPNVNFFTGSAKLTPTSISDIQQVAEYLIDHPEVTAQVIGHTDSVGNPASNRDLSQRRAESVRNMIVTLGVNQERVTAIGKGDTQPRADNSTEEGRLMNRRVEVRLTDPMRKKGKAKTQNP